MKFTSRHIIFEMQNMKDNEEMFKVARKRKIGYLRRSNKLYFSQTSQQQQQKLEDDGTKF